MACPPLSRPSVLLTSVTSLGPTAPTVALASAPTSATSAVMFRGAPALLVLAANSSLAAPRERVPPARCPRSVGGNAASLVFRKPSWSAVLVIMTFPGVWPCAFMSRPLRCPGPDGRPRHPSASGRLFAANTP